MSENNGKIQESREFVSRHSDLESIEHSITQRASHGRFNTNQIITKFLKNADIFLLSQADSDYEKFSSVLDEVDYLIDKRLEREGKGMDFIPSNTPLNYGKKWKLFFDLHRILEYGMSKAGQRKDEKGSYSLDFSVSGDIHPD